jgi:AcrR family transcriptional regulator
MSSRKAALLDGALRYLLEHGVANASLRPLATELGTSARILMFHFKSKEGLLQEVMKELNLRLQRSLEAMVRSHPAGGRVAPLKRFWQWATREENLPLLRLLYEAQIIALQNPAHYRAFLQETSTAWQRIAFDSMSESLRRTSLATLCIAVFDGLMLELMATGDRRRLTRALDEFIALVRASE